MASEEKHTEEFSLEENSLMNKEQELRAMSGRLRIIAATLDPTEFDRDADYEEVKRSLIGTADGISAKASRFAQWEGPSDLADLADGPGGSPDGMPPDVSQMAGDAPQQKEQPGRFDPSRQPAAPLWDITITRIRAGDGEAAHDIVKDLVDGLQKEGHHMAAVGTIKPSIDNPTPKGQR